MDTKTLTDHVVTMTASLATLTDSVNDLKDSVDDQNRRMFVGNGQPSFASRLQHIEEGQESCPAREAFSPGNKRWQKDLAVSLLVAIVTGIGTAFAVYAALG